MKLLLLTKISFLLMLLHSNFAAAEYRISITDGYSNEFKGYIYLVETSELKSTETNLKKQIDNLIVATNRIDTELNKTDTKIISSNEKLRTELESKLTLKINQSVQEAVKNNNEYITKEMLRELIRNILKEQSQN